MTSSPEVSAVPCCSHRPQCGKEGFLLWWNGHLYPGYPRCRLHAYPGGRKASDHTLHQRYARLGDLRWTEALCGNRRRQAHLRLCRSTPHSFFLWWGGFPDWAVRTLYRHLRNLQCHDRKSCLPGSTSNGGQAAAVPVLLWSATKQLWMPWRPYKLKFFEKQR